MIITPGIAFIWGMAFMFFLAMSYSIWKVTRPDPKLKEIYTARIRVPSTWRLDDSEYRQLGVADFQLGPGPCGLTVTALYGSWSHPNEENFTVKQYCSDGSSKLFHYRREDITGRIEETFAERLYTPKKS